MPCPFCATTMAQKRADGRCGACGKLLPKELRGAPDPLPRVSVPAPTLKPGDSVEMYGFIRRGDIVVLLQIHQNRFAILPVTVAQAAFYAGPKYIAPEDLNGLPVIFVMEGWEEYLDVSLTSSPAWRPWWKFW